MLCDKTAKYRLYEITLQHDNNSEHAVVTTEDCTEAYTVTYSSGGVVTRCVDVISSVVVSVVVVESVVLRLSCDVVCAAVAVVVSGTQTPSSMPSVAETANTDRHVL